MKNSTDKDKLPAIPTTYMPEDWREQGAAKFNCSKNKIERTVYVLMPKPDTRIYEFMLSLAEEGRRLYEAKKIDLSKRVAIISEV